MNQMRTAGKEVAHPERELVAEVWAVLHLQWNCNGDFLFRQTRQTCDDMQGFNKKYNKARTTIVYNGSLHRLVAQMKMHTTWDVLNIKHNCDTVAFRICLVIWVDFTIFEQQTTVVHQECLEISSNQLHSVKPRFEVPSDMSQSNQRPVSS